jgi:hypothetical protein
MKSVLSVTFVINTTDSSRSVPVTEVVVNISCLNVNCVLFDSVFNQTCMFSTDYSNRPPNIKFNAYLPSGSRVVPRGRMGEQIGRLHEDNRWFSRLYVHA